MTYTKAKKPLCHDLKINTLITQYALYRCTKHLAYTHIFENELFLTTAVQQRQQVDSVGCCTVFSGLISSLSLIICKFLVGTSTCIAAHWLQTVWLEAGWIRKSVWLKNINNRCSHYDTEKQMQLPKSATKCEIWKFSQQWLRQMPPSVLSRHVIWGWFATSVKFYQSLSDDSIPQCHRTCSSPVSGPWIFFSRLHTVPWTEVKLKV